MSVFLFVCPTLATAQTFLWNGNVGSNWTTSGNWVGGIAPTPGQDLALTFSSGASNFSMVNDYSDLVLNSLSFNEPGYLLSGNSITFVQTSGGNLPTVSGDLNTIVSTDWILNDELTVSAGASSFVYAGTMSGNSAFNLYGAFTLAGGGQINNSGAINITSNTGTVTIDGTIGNGGLLTIDNNRTLAGTGSINRDISMSGAANITSTDTLTVNGNVSITNAPNNLLAGTWAVNGLMEINGGLLQQSAGTALSGAGNILITGGGSAAFDGTVAATKNIELAGILFPVFIYGTGTINGDIIVNGDHFVGLNGSLTLNGNTVFANSVVQAYLGHQSGTLTNNGSVVVTNGGTVRLEGDVQSTSFGAIGVDPGGRLQLTGNTLDTNSNLFNGGIITVVDTSTIGGTFGLEDGGILELNGHTLNADSLFLSNGMTSIINGGTVTVGDLGLSVESGTLTVGPGIEVNSTGVGTLTIDAGANLIANGTVNLNTLARGTLDGGAGSLINNALTTENAILIGILNVQNTLTVQAVGLTQLQAGADLTVVGLTTIQQGGLIVSEFATMNAFGNISVIDDAIFNVNGTVTTGQLTMDDTTMLQGNGLMIGDMTLNGMIGPGNSAGRLKVDGNITLAPTSTVCIEIGGTGEGTFDVLDGYGGSTLVLNGSRLDLSLINGFVPDAGHEFQFLKDFDKIVGMFGNGDGFGDSDPRIFFAGGSFAIIYERNSIRLGDFQPVPEPGSMILCGFCGIAILMRKRRRNPDFYLKIVYRSQINQSHREVAKNT